MLVNTVVSEGISLAKRIKSSPELIEKVIQYGEKNAEMFATKSDSFSRSMESLDAAQFEAGNNKIKELIASIPPSVEAKVNSLMEHFDATAPDIAKDPMAAFGDLSAVLRPRTELKRALRIDPEAQTYLKKLVAGLGDSDVKNVFNQANEKMNYKNVFDVKTINEFAEIISPDIPGFKDFVVKAEPIVDKPMGERIQEFISYFIKQ